MSIFDILSLHSYEKGSEKCWCFRSPFYFSCDTQLLDEYWRDNHSILNQVLYRGKMQIFYLGGVFLGIYLF